MPSEANERGFKRLENGDVQLTMSQDDYDRLLIVCGYAQMASMSRKGGILTPDKVLGFLNRVCFGSVTFTPYEVSEEETYCPYGVLLEPPHDAKAEPATSR